MWTGWRGRNRDGWVASLPDRLSEAPQVQWSVDLLRSGLGGIAATDDLLVFGDRDALDFNDVWRCLDARTGVTRWEVQTLAIGELDYGNSPRATPLLASAVVDGRVVPEQARAFLLGAQGDLLCVSLNAGKVLWKRNLREDFGANGERPWGYCGSPLLVANKLIVQPGAERASIVALDPATGRELWRTPGGNVGYGSLIVAKFGGRRQIVGHDETSLNGWDVETGERLWRLTPPIKGDFNVPTPLEFDGKLLVTTENNGTRLYAFDEAGRIRSKPLASNDRLRPSMSTPVVVGSRLFCIRRFLYCLDASAELTELWRKRDSAYGDYAAIVTDGKRLLLIGKGEVLLVGAESNGEVISRWTVFPERLDVYSHAAVVGDLLYVRGEKSLKCLKLK